MISSITENKQIIDSLEDFVSDQKLAKLESKLKIFNILEIFKIKFSETSFSAFLAWLLNPSENHGLGDYFLKYFLINSVKSNPETAKIKVMDIDSLDLNDAIIKTEETFRTKRADITIKIEKDNFLCLIENKIKSSESKEQTENYANLSKQKYPDFKKILYVFLTPYGDDPKSKEFGILTYQDLRELLFQTVEFNKENINDEIQFLINQFIQNIEVNILNEGEIPKLCKELYKRHKEAIDRIISNIPILMEFIKDELSKIFKDDWQIYQTKTSCFLYKKQWLKDFNRFYSQYYPFIHYEICSWDNNGIFISTEFHVEEKKKLTGGFNLRKSFTDILDEKFENIKIDSYIYKKEKLKGKFKKIIIEEGFDDDEELKLVIHEMKKLVQETIVPLEKAIDTFKTLYKEELGV